MAKKSKKKDNSSALNSNISPLKINSTLVKGAALTNYYSGGETATGYGEIKWDKMFDPMKKALQDAMNVYQKFGSKGDSDVCECKEEGADGVTKTYTGRRNPETGKCECDPGSGEGESRTDKEERKTQPENIWPEDKNKQTETDCDPDTEEWDGEKCVKKKTSPGGKEEITPTEVPSDFVPQDCDCIGADGVTKTKGKTTPDGGCDCAAEEAASTTTSQEELDKQNEEEQKKLNEQKKAEELKKQQQAEAEELKRIEEDLRKKNLKINRDNEYSSSQQEAFNNSLSEDNVNVNVVSNWTDKNSPASNHLGGGNLERKKGNYQYNFEKVGVDKNEFMVDANGEKIVDANGNNIKNPNYKKPIYKITGQTNKGKDSQGKEFDYSFNTEDGNINFNANVWNPTLSKIPGFPGKKPPKGKYLTISPNDWNTFVDNYTQILNSAKIKRSKVKERGDIAKQNFTKQEIAVLKMEARGFFTNPIVEPPPAQEDDSGLGGYKEDSPVTYKIPIKKTTPFARRDRGYLNVRKKWMPNQPQQDMMGNMGTPMEYDSPFHQEEIIEDSLQQTPVSESGETIWDKMMMYGDGIDNQVEKFISHTEYDPNFQKPIETIKNQEWVGTITKWLKNKKQEIIDASKNKDKLLEQQLNAHVNTLIQDVTSYAGKFIEWLERNGSDATPGAIGGSVVSDGSRKDEKFIANLAFMGDTNTDFGIDPEGRIGIKSYGLEDIRRVQDLDGGVFRKDDSGLATFLDILGTMQDDAEANRPLNENIVKGQADLLIKQQDSLLSWAHDPLYGQAWIQDFAQANPNEDISWAMPESDMFDKERLEDEIHGWLVNKLTQAYNNRRPKNEKSVDQIHKETMVSLEKQETKKNQKLPQHMMRNSPLANKSRAQQLIEKYS